MFWSQTIASFRVVHGIMLTAQPDQIHEHCIQAVQFLKRPALAQEWLTYLLLIMIFCDTSSKIEFWGVNNLIVHVRHVTMCLYTWIACSNFDVCTNYGDINKSSVMWSAPVTDTPQSHSPSCSWILTGLEVLAFEPFKARWTKTFLGGI